MLNLFLKKFGSLWYNTWTIVLIAWLWLVSSVDTTQAHIYYIYTHPNLSQIKSLQIYSLDSGERKLWNISRRFRVSQKLRTWHEVSRLLGYKYPLSPRSNCFYSLSLLTAASLLPSPPPLPHLAPWVIFVLPPIQIFCEWGIEFSKEWRSKIYIVLKDWRLSPSLPKGNPRRTPLDLLP
jgi:hypothetical protein